MKNLTKTLVIGLLGIATAGLPAMAAKTKPPASQPAEDPAEFAKSAEAHAASLIDGLKIDDGAKADRAKTALTAYLVDIHQWHVTNDDKIKELSKGATSRPAEVDEIQAQRHAIHDADMAKLSAELTPEQLEKIKEKLTGGQMMATVKNYPVIVPNLTDDDQAMILKTLIAAREDAMDSASKNERVAVFKKYKGQINNYLDAHGHNVKQAYADWGAAQKKKAGAATQPADDGANPN